MVKVWLKDPNGRNLKEHPVVLVDMDDEIKANSVVNGVVASNTAAIKVPRLDTWIELPYHSGGRCHTGFDKPTVAVCEWHVTLEKATITEAMIEGRVQARYVLEIRDKLKAIRAAKLAAKLGGSRPSGA